MFLSMLILVPLLRPHVSAKDLIGTWEGKWNNQYCLITFNSNGLYSFSYDSSSGLVFKGLWSIRNGQLIISEEVEINQILSFKWIFKRIDYESLKFDSKGTTLELIKLIKPRKIKRDD